MKRIFCFLCVCALLCPFFDALAAPKPQYYDVLLIGEDDADRNTVLKAGRGYGRADALVLLRLEMGSGHVSMVSVDRHLMADVPGEGIAKLCIANYMGGPKLQVEVLNETLDLNITRYAMVGKNEMAKLVDVLGGVQVEIHEDDLYIKVNGKEQFKTAGTYTLNSAQVVAYMGSREQDSDERRNQRQREVLIAIATKMANLKSFDAMQDMIIAMLPYIDTNVTTSELFSAALSVFGNADAMEIEELRVPLTGSTQGINFHLVTVVEDIEQEIARLKEFLDMK